MTWWVQFPYDFLSDPRVKVLSLSARGVLASLIVQAKGAAVVPYVNHHDAVGTVAVVALREGAPADPRAAVGLEVDALVAAGLITWSDDAREIFLHLAASESPRPRVAAPAVAREAPAARRTKPSDDRARATWRAARHYFEKRLRQWSKVPAAETWEGWLAGPEGESWADGNACNALRNAALQALPQRPATPHGNAPATPPPPHTPSPEKDRENLRDTQSGNAPATPRAATRNATPQRPVAGGVATDGVMCGSEEHLGIDPEAALFAVRTRAGKDRINLAYDTRTVSAWSAVVRELSALPDSPAATIGGFEVLGDWIAADGLGWWSQGRPSLAYLLRPGELARRLEESAAWARAGRPPIRHDDRPARRGRPGPAPASASFDDDSDPFAAQANARGAR